MQQYPATNLEKQNIETQKKKKSIFHKERKIRRGITLVEKLAGSLKMPEKWKGKGIDQIIEESKQEYFSKKYGKR